MFDTPAIITKNNVKKIADSLNNILRYIAATL